MTGQHIAILVDGRALPLWKFVAVRDIVREHAGGVALVRLDVLANGDAGSAPPDLPATGDLSRFDPTVAISHQHVLGLAGTPIQLADLARAEKPFGLIVDLCDS